MEDLIGKVIQLLLKQGKKKEAIIKYLKKRYHIAIDMNTLNRRIRKVHMEK